MSLSRIGASANAQLRVASRFSYKSFSTSVTPHFLSIRTLERLSQLRVLQQQQQQQSPKVQCRSYADSTSSPSYDSDALKTGMKQLEDEQGQDEQQSLDDVDATSSPMADLPPLPNKEVFVRNLDYDMQENDLLEEFGRFGQIADLFMMKGADREFNGRAIIGYRSAEDAAAAIEGLDHTILHGRTIYLQPSVRAERHVQKQTDIGTPNKTLFIYNVPYNVTDQALNDLFRQTSGIRDVRVAVDRDSGLSRGYLHADFKNIDAATAAMSILQGQRLHDRAIKVIYQADKYEREARSAADSASATPEDITTTTEAEAALDADRN